MNDRARVLAGAGDGAVLRQRRDLGSPKPACASTSSVCSPSAGPGVRPGCAGVRPSLIGAPSCLIGSLAPRLVERHDHLPRPDQLGIERLVEVEHRLQAAVVLGCERAPLLARALPEDLAHRRWASEPGGSNWLGIRSGRPTPSHHACQNFGSSAPSET